MYALPGDDNRLEMGDLFNMVPVCVCVFVCVCVCLCVWGGPSALEMLMPFTWRTGEQTAAIDFVNVYNGEN